MSYCKEPIRVLFSANFKHHCRPWVLVLVSNHFEITAGRPWFWSYRMFLLPSLYAVEITSHVRLFDSSVSCYCNGGERAHRISPESSVYRCLCMAGYYGTRCELFDPCSAQQSAQLCRNGGTCRNTTDGNFTCSCVQG